MTERKPPNMKVVSIVTTVAFALIGFGLAYFIHGQNLLGAFGISAAGLGVALLGALVAFVLAAVLYLTLTPVRDATENVALKMVRHVLSTEGWLGVVFVTLLSPLGEEILFRGGVQGSLGVIVTAVLFGLSHGGWRKETWGYALSATITGLVLGEVYSSTGSLTASTITHVVFNLIVTIMLARGIWPFRAGASQTSERA